MRGTSIDELEHFLEQSPPRRPPAGIRRAAFPRYFGYQMALALVFGLVFILMAAPSLLRIFPLRPYAAIRMSLSAPATTEGEVTDEPVSLFSINGADVYRTHFTFDVDGAHHRGFSHSRGERFAPGDKVGIEYVPGNPRIARIVGTGLTPGWGILAVMIFPTVGGFVAFTSLRRWYDTRRLLRSGAFAAGRVRSVERLKFVEEDGLPVYRIHIEFKDDNGAELTTSWNTQDEDAVRLARRRRASDGFVGVLYDPVRPKYSILVDSLLRKGELLQTLNSLNAPDEPYNLDDLEDLDNLDDLV